MVRNQIENVTFSFKNLSKSTPDTRASLRDFNTKDDFGTHKQKNALERKMRNDFIRKGLSQFTNIRQECKLEDSDSKVKLPLEEK